MALSELLETTFPTSRPTDPMSLHEFAFGKPQRGWFSEGLELLGRPQLAIGEAIGSAIRDEDPWAGVKRGIEGRRKYGTLGEQLFHVKPDEDTALVALLKQAGILGADVATDPALLIGAPLVGKGIAAGVKGAEKIGISGKALMRKFPGLAKLVLPVTTHLRWLGGKSGRTAARLWDVAEDTKSLRLAQAEIELGEMAKSLGLGSDAAARVAAVDHLESGALRSGLIHPDDRVQQFASYIDELGQKLGLEIEGFRDPDGKGFQIVEPVLRSVAGEIRTAARKLGLTSAKTKRQIWEHVSLGTDLPDKKGAAQLAESIMGKLNAAGVAPDPAVSIFSKEFYKRPFRRIPNYFPHLATPDFLRSIETSEGLSKAAREMAKMNGISEFEAMRILKQIGAPRRAGNIEYARTLKMPGYEKDPLVAIPRYLDQVFGRLEYARNFGVEGQVLDKLMKRATTKKIQAGGAWKKIPGLSAADAQAIRDTILGRPLPRGGSERVARAIMNYQVLTKMGPLSAISNISQNANTITREGGVNFLKGIVRSMSSEGARQGQIAYAGGIREHLMRMMGASGQASEWWLKWSGFTPAERLNRILASNTGIVEAERLLRQSGGRLTRNLIRRGLTEEDIPQILANNWKLPTEIADRVGLLASNATQHVTRLKDVPLAWQSPGMRSMVQFKSFVFQQTRFLLREVLQPALEYFQTNGRSGAVAPLARFAATFGLGGGVVAYARDNARALSAKLTGLEHEPREAVPDDWLLRVMEDALNMGGLGVAGDLVQRAASRDFKGWLLGPTIGDFSDFVELMATSGSRAYRQREIDLEAVGREAIRHLPVISPVLPRRPAREAAEEYFGELGVLLGL